MRAKNVWMVFFFNIYMFTTTCFIDRIKIYDKSNLSSIKFWHICCELHYLAAGDSCPLKSCMENKNDLEAEFQRRVKMDAGPTGMQVTFGKDLFTFSCRYVSYCFKWQIFTSIASSHEDIYTCTFKTGYGRFIIQLYWNFNQLRKIDLLCHMYDFNKMLFY